MKYLTPEICREALNFLWDGTEPMGKNKMRYICWCINRTVGRWTITSRACREFSEMLLEQNAIEYPYDELPFHNFSDKNAQEIRFMLLELTAQMLEDNAL